MSDPVTNAEVEDVLSSIRRLVSEDRPAKPQSNPQPAAEDRLVLTPSLRVSNEAPARQADKPTGQRSGIFTAQSANAGGTVDSRPGLRGNDNLRPSQGLDRTEAYAEAMGDIADDRFDDADPLGLKEDLASLDFTAVESVSGEADPLGASAANPAHTPAKTSALESEPAKPETYKASERRSIDRPHGMMNLGDSELVEDVPPTPDRLSAKIAALETAISRIPENWEPENPGDGDYSGSEDPAMDWEDDLEFDATGRPVGIDDATSRPHVSDADEGAVPTQPTPADDDDDIDDHYHETQPMFRHQAAPDRDRSLQARDVHSAVGDETVEAADVAPEAVVEPRESTETGDQSDTGFGFAADEYFDEDMLRDLVSEIVRSELQGALGERITRNVRKLVRREIHRAMTSQDLE